MLKTTINKIDHENVIFKYLRQGERRKGARVCRSFGCQADGTLPGAARQRSAGHGLAQGLRHRQRQGEGTPVATERVLVPETRLSLQESHSL